MGILMGGGWLKGESYLKVFPETLSILINTKEPVRIMLYHKAPFRGARQVAGTVEASTTDAAIAKVLPEKSVTDEGQAAEFHIRAGVPGVATVTLRGTSAYGDHGEAWVRVKVRVPRSARSQEIVDSAQPTGDVQQVKVEQS